MAGPNPDCPARIWPSRGDQQRTAFTTSRPSLAAYVPLELRSVLFRDTTDPLATARLGITLRGLRRVEQRLRERFGDELASMSTADVNTRWVEVVTQPRQCRLVELEEVVDPGDVAPPAYFLSHAWANKAARLFEFVFSYLQNASDDTMVWLDILCVNQHEETLAHSHDVHRNAFSSVVQACSAGTIVVLDSEARSPATRCWCLFEWAHTLAVHGPDGLHMHLGPQDRARVFGSINVEEAECFKPEDKVMLLAEIKQRHTSSEWFDASLKLQLLLEPLSYSVDLRRLLQRAGEMGTQWQFKAVEEWLASDSRLLCIAAGAGEGKSTISAALCSGELSGRVTAHHFIKYNDGRRLEAVRVVKSLAFQLALRLPCVRESLLQLDVALVAQLSDMEEAFTLLLLQPLQLWEQQQSAAPDLLKGRVVLLLDALDEADPISLQQLQGGKGGASHGSRVVSFCPKVCGNRMLQLLTTHLQLLPVSVRFIVTTRPDAAAGQVLPCLDRTFPSSVVHLQPSTLRGAAVLAGRSRTTGLVEGGIMVYHTAAAAAAAASRANTQQGSSTTTNFVAVAAADAPPPFSQLQRAPQLHDVYNLYDTVFRSAHQQYGSAERIGHVADLLAVITAAKEPLPQSFLQQLGLADAVPLLPGYAQHLFFVDEHRIFIFHKSLGDWLLDTSKSGSFAADVRRGHELIGLHLAKQFRRQQYAGNGSSSSDAYTLKYVVAHLAAAADGGGGTAVTAAAADSSSGSTLDDLLLQDFCFMHAAVVAGQGPAVIGALGAMQSPSPATYDTFRWLRAELYNLLSDHSTSAEAFVQHGRHAPVATNIYKAAVRNEPWRTRAVLPQAAGCWPAFQATLKSHLDDVLSVAYSPDGSQLASSSTDKTVRIWDAATGQCTATLQGHSGRVNSVAYSPDGTQLASSSMDRTVHTWDAATGQCTATLQGHSDSVNSVAYSPDGKQLASSSTDGTVRIWDAATGQCTATLQGHSGAVVSVAYSPDGSQLASSSMDRTVRTWDAATGQCTATLQGHSDAVFSVAYSPDGKQLASGSVDKTVRIWDAATGQSTAALQGHSYTVISVAYSPNGTQLASGSYDRTVRIWDAATGQCTATMQGHLDGVISVAYSPDGSQLASGSTDRTVRIWDAAIGQGYQGTVTLHGHMVIVPSVAYSPDGKQLASGSGDKNVHVWDAATGQCTTMLQGHLEPVRSVAYSPDSTQLASGSVDKTVRIWDAATGQSTAVLQGHSDAVISVAYSPDGKQLASGSADNTVRIWDAATGQCTTMLQGHLEPVRSVAYSPDSMQLASGSVDKTVRIWDAATGQSTAALQGHSDAVFSVAYSPDGKQLASGSADKTVRIWDAATGQCTATLQGHSYTVISVAYSPNSTQLASGSADKTVRVWDAATGQCTTMLQGHLDPVWSVAYSPDGTQLASGSSDKTVRIWEQTFQTRAC